MWERLSLRTRLLLPLGLMFVAALLLGGVSLQIFATTQLMEENEPAARSARAVAAALNGALQTSTNPQATLDAFVQSLGSIRSHPVSARSGPTSTFIAAEVQTPLGTVPDWFVRLLAIPEFRAAFPVTIEGKQVGDIVFAPDLSADIYEKWIGFLAIACSGIALMLLTGAIAHFAARSALATAAKSGRRPDPHANGRLRAADSCRRPARDPQERAGSQRTRPHPQSPQPGQSQPAAPDRVAAGRRAPGYGARASRRTRAAAVRDPRQHGGAAGIDPVRPGRSRGAPPRAFCSRSKRCSRRTAASSTGCGRSTSRNSAWRGASRRCCRMRRRRRRTSR